jgi:predicted nucleic acid-binding protein
VATAVETNRLHASLPLLLEAGYSARNGPARAQLIEELLALPWAGIDGAVERRAIQAQGQLARVGHHRLPPVGVLLAALAERHDLGILHYDRDYDLLAGSTDLRFESLWLAPPGSL